MQAVILSLILAAVFAGQNCPGQTFKEWTACPATVDAAKIITDPASGKQLCINWVIGQVGVDIVARGKYCDPEGDPVTIYYLGPSAARVSVLTDGTYTLTAKWSTPGVYYLDLQASDDQGGVRKGTWVFIVLPPNQAPVFY